MFLRMGRNEFGTIVSVHTCDACGEDFTVCPPKIGEGGDEEWGGCCLAERCPSYDPARDADRFFDGGDGPVVRRRPTR